MYWLLLLIRLDGAFQYAHIDDPPFLSGRDVSLLLILEFLISTPSSSSSPLCSAAFSGTSTAPLSNSEIKETKETMANTIFNYLLANNYSRTKIAISPQHLVQGNSQVVKEVLTFLFQTTIDPRFEFNPQEKYYNEAFLFFKKLGYHNTSLKGALQSPGCVSWHIALTAMVWLIECGKNSQAVVQQREMSENPDADPRCAFHGVVVKGFEGWMEGRHDATSFHEIINADVNKEVEADNREREAIAQQIAEVQAAIELCAKHNSPLGALDQHKRDLLAKVESQHQGLIDVTAKEEMVQEKLEKRQVHVAEQRGKIEELKREKEELSARIAGQEITQVGFEKLVQQRSSLDDMLYTLNEQAQKYEADKQTKRAELEKRIAVITKYAHDTNIVAREVAMIPATAKNAKGVDYMISVDPGSPDVVNVDLEDMEAAISDLRQRLSGSFREAGAGKNEKLSKLDQYRDEVEMIRAKLRRENDNVSKLEAEIEATAESNRMKMAKHTEEAEDLEASIAQYKQAKIAVGSGASALVADVEKQLADLKTAVAMERGATNEAVCTIADAIALHINNIQTKLQAIQKQARAIGDAI